MIKVIRKYKQHYVDTLNNNNTFTCDIIEFIFENEKYKYDKTNDKLYIVDVDANDNVFIPIIGFSEIMSYKIKEILFLYIREQKLKRIVNDN